MDKRKQICSFGTFGASRVTCERWIY